ncbi:MAG: serine hydrolase [Bryobacterales bacterium]|nr:serine hydrolase [Bryobacterales bacterium]
MLFRCILLLLLLATAMRLAAQIAVADLDRLVERRFRERKVPGLAIGIMQDGKVLLAKGYGVRDAREKKPVTTRTVFAVGSVTKSFTSAVLATLADQGRISWDTPVREYLPWFRMYDPVATELITLRDMLSHRTGLPRHDFIRFSTWLSREDLVRRVRYFEPSRTFRDVYQYNNLMYVAAGYIGGVVAGSTWEDMVRDRIFRPLGMTRSNTSVLDTQRSDDFAIPHESGKPVEFYEYAKFGVGPNGAVNTCIDDLLKYLDMYLDDTPVLSARQREELWKPVIPMNATMSYAMGWQVGIHGGQYRVSHGGAITGFRAAVVLLPYRKVAIAALVNDESNLADSIANELTDRMIGHNSPPRPSTPPPARPADQPIAGAKTSKPLASFTGTYLHPAFGRVPVELENEQLVVRFPALRIRLRHFHYDVFTMSGWPGRARFEMDEQGVIREMHLPLEAAVKPLVFRRVQ